MQRPWVGCWATANGLRPFGWGPFPLFFGVNRMFRFFSRALGSISVATRFGAAAAAFVAAAVVAACGGTTTIESQLVPSRIVSFGDGLSDLGAGNGGRFTVNDGKASIWTERLAIRYGQTLTASITGGQSYAQGNARVALKPDAGGSSATRTLKEQIDAFLAKGSFGAKDVVVVSMGTSDVIAAYAATGTGAATLPVVQQAALDFGSQIRRLTAAGAKYVLVTGVYDLGKTPWAVSTPDAAFISNLALKFNERLVVDIVNLGQNVLYLDGFLYFSPVFSFPNFYGLSDSTRIACTSVDAGNGIGIGVGQVSSALCNTSTLAVVTATVAAGTVTTSTAAGTVTVSTPAGSVTSTVSYNTLIFADKVYPTPAVQVLFGDYAYGRITGRW